MQPYIERAGQAVCGSDLAVMVLLNSDNTDLVFWDLVPRNPAGVTSPEEFAARKLRPVGVVALSGAKTRVALKEQLDDQTMEAIAAAFATYVSVLLKGSVSAQLEEQFEKGDSVAWLNRLYSLPDTRTELT